MAVQGPPVTINELVQLTNVGIPLDQVTWSRVTLTSDKWIAIRHGKKREDASRCMVTVMSPMDGSLSYAGQTSADSVQMNPSEPLIALKAGQRFEVFNIETKQMVTKTKIHDPVCFWTWLTSGVVAMVTDSAIFHWHLSKGKDTHPEVMFSRHSRLAFTEITSYKADPSLKWLAITGLTPEHTTRPDSLTLSFKTHVFGEKELVISDVIQKCHHDLIKAHAVRQRAAIQLIREEDKISGVTQLYNAGEDITQCISCQVVCFDTYKFAGNRTPSTVLCVASRDVQNHGKVHVIELGPYKTGNFAPRNSYDHIHFFDDVDHYDFPVALHVSGEYGLLLLLTKYGYLYLCEMETSSCLCCTRVSLDIIFTSTLNTATQGIIGVTRSGQVLTIDVKKDGLVNYVRDTAKKSNQADRLEILINVPGNNGNLQ